MADELISAEEAAKILGVSRATVYNMISRGAFHTHEIPGVRRKRLYRSEVEALVPKPPAGKAKDKQLKNK